MSLRMREVLESMRVRPVGDGFLGVDKSGKHSLCLSGPVRDRTGSNSSAIQRMYGAICFDTRDRYLDFPWSSEER